eukprot:UN21857
MFWVKFSVFSLLCQVVQNLTIPLYTVSLNRTAFSKTGSVRKRFPTISEFFSKN